MIVRNKLARFAQLVLIAAFAFYGAAAQSGPASQAERASAEPIRGTVQIILRRGAVADAEGGITVGEVARVTGAASSAVRGIVLVADPHDAAGDRSYLVLDASTVASRLHDAGLRPSQIAVTGGRCVVRFGKREAVPQAAPERPKTDEHTLLAADTDPRTVRGAIAKHLTSELGVSPDHIRLTFEDRDRVTLRIDTASRRLTVRPTTSTNAARVVFEVHAFDAEGGLVSRTRLRVDVDLRSRSLRALRRIERGEVVSPDFFEPTETWSPPGGDEPIDAEAEVDGWIAARRIDEGDVLTTDHIAPPVLIERGDIVRVFAHSGGFTVQLKARALEDGGPGDAIALKLDNADAPFIARVDGPKRAVMSLDTGVETGSL